LIITQGKFSQDFLNSLPDLEKEMVNHGLDPGDFIIVKSNSHRWDYFYTVTVKGKSFTISMVNDVEFLKYFYGICFPAEDNAHTLSVEHKFNALLQRLEKWLVEDPVKGKD